MCTIDNWWNDEDVNMNFELDKSSRPASDLPTNMTLGQRRI